MRLILTIDLPASADEADVGTLYRELTDVLQQVAPRNTMYRFDRGFDVLNEVQRIFHPPSPSSSPISSSGR